MSKLLNILESTYGYFLPRTGEAEEAIKLLVMQTIADTDLPDAYYHELQTRIAEL